MQLKEGTLYRLKNSRELLILLNFPDPENLMMQLRFIHKDDSYTNTKEQTEKLIFEFFVKVKANPKINLILYNNGVRNVSY